MSQQVVEDRRMLIPQLPPRHVSRARLLGALDRSADIPLTLLAAGPGAGKTVLLSEWARRRDPLPAWVTLDAGADDPDRFVVAVTTALQAAGFPETGTSLPPTGGDIGTEALAERVLLPVLESEPDGTPGLLILDDAHVLTHPEILEAIDAWIRRWPSRLHLILAARSDPMLPLHRYRLAGTMTELRAAQLAMTDDETDDLLRAHRVRLAPRDVSRLNRRVEGWAAGVRLSAMRMEGLSRAREFVTEFALDEASIGEYLMDEVLNEQSIKTRQLLIETSFLPEIDAELAAVVTGIPEASEILDHLAATNSFVMPTDTGPSTFRCHQLLREILQYLLQARPPERRTDLRARAARWYLEHDDVTNALRYAAETENWGLISEVVIQRGLSAFVDRTPLERIDGHALAAHAQTASGRDRTRALVVAAIMLVRTGQPAEARRLLRSIRGELRTAGDDAIELAQLATLTAARALHLVADTDLAAKSLIDTADQRRWPSLAAAVRLEQAMAHFYAGSHAGVEATLHSAIEDARVAGIRQLQLECLAQLAHVNAFWARLRTSLDASREAGALLRRDPRLTAPPALLVATAIRRVLKTDYAGTVSSISRARRMVQHRRDWDLRAEIDVLRSIVDIASGRIDDAREALRECRCLPPGLTKDYSVSAAAAIEVIAGRPHEGLRLLDEQQGSPPSSVLCLARALASVALGDADGADTAIRPVLTASGVPSIRTVLVAALVMDARSAALRGDADIRATESLVRAIELANNEMDLPFAGAVDQLGDLITRHPMLLAQWPAAIETAPAADAPPVQHRAPVLDPLTEKERAVLRLLATTMPTREMAVRLGLSVNTVKTHIAAIYRKLGAPRRRDAVLRARSLELL